MTEAPYHYQFRIIVIGDTMVGKSSLLRTFSEGTFGEMEPTVGVDFFSKIIKIRPKQLQSLNNNTTSNNEINNKIDDTIIVKLQIWDTAGQERFKSIVTSYYRNSVGIILVYDVTNRESYNHLIDWFTEARRHVEPNLTPSLSPIISTQSYPYSSTPNQSGGNNLNSASRDVSIVSEMSSFSCVSESYKMAYLVLGCKSDLGSERQVSFEDGQAFADTYGFKFIETSSKRHYNVDEAFRLLAEEIYDNISELSRLNRLHRTASGGHLTFDTSQISEGIRIGPLLGNTSRLHRNDDGIQLLEAQPVPGLLGGCC